MPTLQESYSSQGEKEIGKAYFSFVLDMNVIPFYYDDVDDLLANCYVVIGDNDECIVIDPSKDYDGIVKYIKKNELTLKGVLLTHGHFDHFRGVDRLIDEFHCPLYIGFYDADMIKNPELNCSVMLNAEYVVKSKAETVSDGEILHLLKEDIKVLEMPGHTAGSVCYYFKDSKVLFTGDFLFCCSAGRCDLPTGNERQMNESFRKVAKLDGDIRIYPGHGPKSTLESEFKENPFLRFLQIKTN